MQKHLDSESKDINLNDVMFNYLAKLSLAERQLLKIMIANKADDSPLVVITTKDYAEAQGITLKKSVNQIPSVLSSFFNRYIKIPHLVVKPLDTVTSRWIDFYRISDDGKTVHLGFSQPFCSLVDKVGVDKTLSTLEFLTSKPVSKLENIYSVHFFNYLESLDTSNTTEIEVKYNDFRQLLKVEDGKYNTIQNFKSRVLHPVISEMKEKVGLNIRYKDVRAKSGSSKITGFCFYLVRQKR